MKLSFNTNPSIQIATEIKKTNSILKKDLVEKGSLKPVIDRCYPFEEIAEAHRYVDKGHIRGNVFITVRI